MLPRFMGIEGIIYAAPIADFAAAATALIMIFTEMRAIRKLERACS